MCTFRKSARQDPNENYEKHSMDVSWLKIKLEQSCFIFAFVVGDGDDDVHDQ